MSILTDFIHQHQTLPYIFTFCALFLVLFLLDPPFGIIHWTVQSAKRLSSSKPFLIIFFLSTFIFLTFFAKSVLQRFPDTGSEYNYIYQADTFLKGRLWNKPPPQDFFMPGSPVINKNGKWLARSFPGWPVLIGITKILHIPVWMLNPILGAISLIILFLLAKILYDNTAGFLSVVAALCSPFFIFNSASFEPHTACGLFILLAVYYFYLLDSKNDTYRQFLMIGICFGAAYFIRPFSTLCCLIPILIVLKIKTGKGFFRKDLYAFLLGIAPFLVMGFLYNYFITGNFLISPFNWTAPGDTVQFKKSVILDNIYGIKSQLLWMNPAIYVLYYWMVISLILKRKNQVQEIFFLLLVTACFFYHLPKESYGTRYYYEGYLLCVLTVIGRLSQLPKGPLKRSLALALLAGFLTSLLSLPVLAMHYKHKIYRERELYRLVESKHLSNAIVFMPPGTDTVFAEARNDPDLQNKVLYVHDLKDENALLLKSFPNREFYIYVPQEKNEDQRIQKYRSD